MNVFNESFVVGQFGGRGENWSLSDFLSSDGSLSGWGLGEIKAPPFSRASQTDSTLKIFKPAKLKHLSQYCDHYQAIPKFKLKKRPKTQMHKE